MYKTIKHIYFIAIKNRQLSVLLGVGLGHGHGGSGATRQSVALSPLPRSCRSINQSIPPRAGGCGGPRSRFTPRDWSRGNWSQPLWVWPIVRQIHRCQDCWKSESPSSKLLKSFTSRRRMGPSIPARPFWRSYNGKYILLAETLLHLNLETDVQECNVQLGTTHITCVLYSIANQCSDRTHSWTVHLSPINVVKSNGLMSGYRLWLPSNVKIKHIPYHKELSCNYLLYNPFLITLVCLIKRVV